MLHPNHIGALLPDRRAGWKSTVVERVSRFASPEARALTSAHECRATSKLLGARSRVLEVDKGNVDLDAFRRLI
jgi:hypothetical protein